MKKITFLKAISDIDEEYLKDYTKVQEERENRRSNKKERMISMKILSPILAVAVIAGIIFIVNPKIETPIVSDLKNTNTEEKEAISININKITGMTSSSLDAKATKILISDLPEKFSFMESIIVPEDYQFDYANEVYTRKDNKTDIYDILYEYDFNYRKDASNRIEIAFSEVGVPLRDYIIGGQDKKISKIADVELVIGEMDGLYGKLYTATFELEGVYFDIETVGLEQGQLVELLESIINGMKYTDSQFKNFEDVDAGIKEPIDFVKDYPDYYGGMYVENGNNVILLVEDTSENRAEICKLLGITESLTIFRTARYSHNYLTILQDKISQAMQNKEFNAVIGSGLMDAQNRILVTMTSENKKDEDKLKKFDNKGGAIMIEVSNTEFATTEDLEIGE